MRNFLLTLVVAVMSQIVPLHADDQSDQLARDNSAFAVDLYHQLASENGNLFFSPYSISTALAMTYAGARSDTAAQMAHALHFSLPSDQLSGAFAALEKQLSAAEVENGITLSVANSIWPSKHVRLLDSFTGLLRQSYGTKLTSLDYSHPEAARRIINTWVEDKTHQKIKDLIGPGILTPDTSLTLVNAIYFYGKWASVFEPGKTTREPFHLGGEKTEEVEMMRQQATFKYADLGTLQILELPYQGRDFSMLILLPKAMDGLPSLEEQLTTQSLAAWTSKLSSASVYASLPKFKITWGTENLNSPLQALGMKDAFSGAANFSGMTDDPRGFFVGGVFHKAFIDVKEEGTEAAAATAVVMMRGAVSAPGTIFFADHPFLFLIKDEKSRTILFMGRVVDPTSGESP